MFELEREKVAAYSNMKRELEGRIDDEKAAQRRESKEMADKLEQAREETGRWKQKYKELQDEMDALDRRYEDSKLRIIEEHENNMGQLKHKYHRTKMLLIETGMQEARSLEESASVQREVLRLDQRVAGDGGAPAEGGGAAAGADGAEREELGEEGGGNAGSDQGAGGEAEGSAPEAATGARDIQDQSELVPPERAGVSGEGLLSEGEHSVEESGRQGRSHQEA